MVHVEPFNNVGLEPLLHVDDHKIASDPAPVVKFYRRGIICNFVTSRKFFKFVNFDVKKIFKEALGDPFIRKYLFKVPVVIQWG
jgi:hypothetical protein